MSTSTSTSTNTDTKPNDDLACIQTYLSHQEDIVLAYLFGSRATGRAAPESDYDIAVLLDEYGPVPVPPDRRYHLGGELGILLSPIPVDLVPLNRAPVEFAYAVVVGGQRLFERSLAERVEYEANILSRYADMLPVLRAQRAELIGGGDYEAGVRRNRAALDKTRRMLAKIRAAAPPPHR